MSYAILLADDSEIVAESLQRWLEREGYEVVIATSCAEAMAIATKRQFAAHILDLEFYDGQGVDLARWLKANGHVADTIFYTGHSPESNALQHAERVGRVVAKGEHPAALLRVIRELVRESDGIADR